jgi:hypothetical protein
MKALDLHWLAALTAFGAFLSAASVSRAAAAVRPGDYGPWRYARIGGGGYIQNVVPCPSDASRYYAYVDVAGAFRSDDAGFTWRCIAGSLPAEEGGKLDVRSLLVDPSDADRVLIATGSQWSRQPGGVYLSTDGGRSWRRTLSASFLGNGPYRWAGVLLARDPHEPQAVLAAAAGEGVFLSGDGGESWQACGLQGIYSTDVCFDPARGERAWVCSRPAETWVSGESRRLTGGLFRSEDGGRTWQKLLDDSPTELLPDPRDAGRLYGILRERPHVSLDAGAAWRELPEGLPPGPAEGNTAENQFNSLAAGPGFVLTASTKGTFYRLPGGAERWEKVQRSGIEEVYCGERWFGQSTGRFGSALSSILVDRRDPTHWFFTDWFALYQSFDAGRDWKLTMDGIECTVLHCLTQDPSDPGVVHLGMADNGYFCSEDGAERFWNVDWQKGISNNVKCIALSPALPGRLYAVGCRTWEWESNQVFVSIDRGRTWTRSPMLGLPDVEAHHANSIEADPADPYTVYLCVSGEVGPQAGGVYRSADGGKSWAWMGAGLPAGQALFAHDIWGVGREIAAGADGSLVCVSRDRWKAFRWDASGGAWGDVTPPLRASPNCVAADLLRPGRFFLAADGVYVSGDGGKTWEQTFDARVEHVVADGARADRVAAATSDGVVLSVDGGRTWTMLDKSLPNRVYCRVAFVGDRLVVGTGGNGAFWMPLSPEAAGPVAARPPQIAHVPGSRAEGAVWYEIER